VLRAVADPRPVPAELRAAWRALGLTSDESLSLLLERTAGRWGASVAVVDLVGGRSLTWHELESEVRAFTAWLRARGVAHGDVVLAQAPNALGLLVAWWAAWQAGCVFVPVVDIYRAHELRRVVELVRPDVVVTVAEHRGHRPPEMFEELLAEADVKARVVVDGEAAGWTSWADARADGAGAAGAPDALAPDEPALVLFTSGTTSAPKGVVHTSRTLTAEARQFATNYGLDWRDVLFLPVPLAHVTGLIVGLLVPGTTGCRLVLSRMAGLERAAEEAVEHEATFTVGPVAEIEHLDAVHRARGIAIPKLVAFATGGAQFPERELRIGEALGIGPARSYGMTECPSVTTPSGADSAHLRLRTDGRMPAGVECQAVDPETRAPLPLGAEGELRVRGPERMVGYLDPDETLAALDREGWFSTGDLGVVDGDGAITITGRIKDIINRGGEKFSARDIENVLLAHAAVAEIAVIAAPDERYGEVPAAFLVAAAGAERPAAPVLADWLATRGVAAQKTPVHWHWLDALPSTPSGKVKKFELRRVLDAARAEGGAT